MYRYCCVQCGSEGEVKSYIPTNCPSDNCDSKEFMVISYDGDDFVDSHWDRGAYKTSRDPKLHKPIKPPEDKKMDITNLCCKKCIYCMRVGFPLSNPEQIQFLCRRYPEVELINQYPDRIDDMLDENQNWCGEGRWLINRKLVSAEQLANEKKEDQKS